ncbi:hypothetical protein SLEP1_g17866 [Rubroshorea leprosula]|uniref:Uncharacterized protein n=1 Tax=Rubroshorea leprosula TaxID=152421 RepID=A0AAV5J7E5_9ROSI|nr:hypothetical protein SLEP1_g17866 [Rubroshorea leprosula]
MVEKKEDDKAKKGSFLPSSQALFSNKRMGTQKLSLLPLLFLVVVFSATSHNSVGAEARPLPFLPQQNYSKLLSTLGVVCKCCDGIGGDCSVTWTDPCSNLQCQPWKQYQNSHTQS